MSNWQRRIMRVMGVQNHLAEVVEVVDLTPWYRRIVLRSPSLTPDLPEIPTLWVRLWFPDATRGPQGLAQRAYTFVSIDRERSTFTLEFVLHEVSGPAGDWARTATVGTRIEAALTPARISLPDDTSRVVLAGDLTALPAINTWLERLPSGTEAQVFLENEHSERTSLPRHRAPGITWHDIVTTDHSGQVTASAITDALEPEPGTFGWAAGEKTLVRAWRPVFRDHLGLDRGHHFSQFYWIRGKATG